MGSLCLFIIYCELCLLVSECNTAIFHGWWPKMQVVVPTLKPKECMVHSKFLWVLTSAGGLMVCCPHMGSGAVMRRDSCVDFGTIYIVGLSDYLTSFLPYFLLSLCFFITYLLLYLFTSWLIYLLLPESTSSFSRPKVVGDQTWLKFFVLILCCSIFCYGCMLCLFSFPSTKPRPIAMTYFVSGGI